MADGGSPRPPQAYYTVSPAGVGTTTTNQVSPGTMQDIFFTGDQSIIDQAMDEMGIDDLTAFLEQLPSPYTVAGWMVPTGVGSQASRTPSTDGARTPLSQGSARLSSGARTPASHVSVPLAAAGAGGGGGGGGDDGSGGSGGSRRSTPRGRPGRGRGRSPRRPNPSPTLPWTRPSPSQEATPRGSWSPGRAPRTLGQADLQRRLRMMLQDQEQLAQGRDISTVTMTNKQGGAPSVQTSSSRLST